MSNHTNSKLYHHPSYFKNHIGGDGAQPSSSSIKDQIKLIKSDNKYHEMPIGEEHELSNINLSNIEKYNENPNTYYLQKHRERYNPYVGFMEKKGLISDFPTNRRFRSNYLHIDSFYRRKVPFVVTEEDVKLGMDPLSFSTSKPNCVTIYHENHNFEIGDLIEITGIYGETKITRLIGSTQINPNTTIQSYSIELFRECNIMKIFVPHGLCIPLQSGLGIIDYEGCIEQQKRIIENKLTVTISNFKGDQSNLFNGIVIPYLQNIPINLINRTHQLYICIDESSISQQCMNNINSINASWLDPSPNHFFIILDKDYNGSFDIIRSTSYPETGTENDLIDVNHNYKIQFDYVKGGIQVDLLNAEFPIDPRHRQGFHKIKEVDINSYDIEISSTVLQNYPHFRYSDKNGNPIIGIDKSTGAPCIFPNIYDKNCLPVDKWCYIPSTEILIDQNINGICIDAQPANAISDSDMALKIKNEIDSLDDFIAIINPLDNEDVIVVNAGLGYSTPVSDSKNITGLILSTVNDGINPEFHKTVIDVNGGFGSLTGGEYFNLYSALDKYIYYVWFDNIGDGTTQDPGPPIPNACSIPINISLSTSDIDIKNEIILSFSLFYDFVINDIGETQIEIINRAFGPSTNTSDGTTGFVILNSGIGNGETEYSTIDTFGILGNLYGGEFFIISDGNNNKYYVWFDTLDNNLQNPNYPGISVKIPIKNSNTDENIANLIGNRLMGTGCFFTNVSGTVVNIWNSKKGNTNSIIDGSNPTNFGFVTIIGGSSNTSHVSEINISGILPGSFLGGEFFNLYSPNNERHYIVWMDTIGNTKTNKPNILNTISVPINISASVTSGDIATEIINELGTYLDFTVIQGLSPESVIISNSHNANSDDIQDAEHPNETNLIFTTVVSGDLNNPEQTNIDVTGSFLNLTGGEYFNAYNPNDEIRYYVWFDKTGDAETDEPLAPVPNQSLPIRVNISTAGSDGGIAYRLRDALIDSGAFFAFVSGNIVTMWNAELGETSFPEDGINVLKTEFEFQVPIKGSAGKAQMTNIKTTGKSSNIDGGEYFILYSANNINKHYFWFDTVGDCETQEPDPADKIVNIDVIGDGGDCVSISKIKEFNPGYPNPNSYIVPLGDVFHNITTIKMVSSEFPNTQKGIVDYPEERRNNRLYWNDINDGDYTYVLEVPPGNYSPTELENVLEKLFLEIPRISFTSNNITSYSDKHIVDVTIDDNTDLVCFCSFKEAIIPQGINNITIKSSVDDSFSSNNYPDDYNPSLSPPQDIIQLSIKINNHGLSQTDIGNTIIILNSIDHMGISNDNINGEHVITNIPDNNTIQINLQNININKEEAEYITGLYITNGGNQLVIHVPEKFRLRFDESDTLGSVLGFRNPGNVNSITNFSSKICNSDKYEFDIEKNSLGVNINLTQNSLKLYGDSYLIMKIEEIETHKSIGPIKNAFAKIQLFDNTDTQDNINSNSNKKLFNTFVNTERIFEDPLHELFEITVNFYNPDGTLFDFNGIDHSYTLDFVTVNDIPGETGINANTGKNYNEKVYGNIR